MLIGMCWGNVSSVVRAADIVIFLRTCSISRESTSPYELRGFNAVISAFVGVLDIHLCECMAESVNYEAANRNTKYLQSQWSSGKTGSRGMDLSSTKQINKTSSTVDATLKEGNKLHLSQLRR